MGGNDSSPPTSCLGALAPVNLASWEPTTPVEAQLSGGHCSSLLSRLREVQSGDDSVLEV